MKSHSHISYFIFLIILFTSCTQQKNNFDTLQEFEQSFVEDLQELESVEDIQIINKYFTNNNGERIFHIVGIMIDYYLRSLEQKGLMTRAQIESQFRNPYLNSEESQRSNKLLEILQYFLGDSEIKITWQDLQLNRKGYIHDPNMIVLYNGQEIKLKIDNDIVKTADGYWKFR